MTVMMDPSEQLPLEEPRLHAGRFVQFMLVAAFAGGMIGIAELVASFASGITYLYELGALTFGVGLVAFIAALLARSGRLSAGVYAWITGFSILMALLPLIVTGLLALVVVGTIANILLVALFLSPRLVRRVAAGLTILVLMATAIETWWPQPLPNARTDLPLVPLIVFPTVVAFIAVLIHQFGNAWLRTMESARTNADQFVQSRAALLRQTAELEETTVNLALRGEELERLNRELQVTGQQAERRAAQLTTSAQVAHAISQVRDLDQLLPQVTYLISQAFGHYQVGIFIVDETGRYAVLRAANSEGGQRDVARGAKLLIPEEGIVGRAIGTGQSRVVPDVSADADFMRSSNLPLTRSEMAMPLRVGDQIIGALEMESTELGAFTESDMPTMNALADQIAIAIENARLFQQTRAALREAEEAQRRYLRQEWEQLLPSLPATRHEYHVSGVLPVGDAPLPEIEQAIRQDEVVTISGDGRSPARAALAVPIKLRGQLIGVIDLHEVNEERKWTDEDIALVTAIADQAALALENARLFAQTQQRARREQLIAQIATRMRAAPDMEGILRTTVHEIRRALGASHGVIRLKAGKQQAADPS